MKYTVRLSDDEYISESKDVEADYWEVNDGFVKFRRRGPQTHSAAVVAYAVRATLVLDITSHHEEIKLVRGGQITTNESDDLD